MVEPRARKYHRDRVAETLREIEKFLFLTSLGLDSLLDEFHKNAVVAEALALGETVYLFCDGSGERHAPSDMFDHGHDIILHHFGASLLGG